MQNNIEVYLGSDHAGFLMKDALNNYISTKYPQFKVVDVGVESENKKCDYNDYADAVCSKILADNSTDKITKFGILCCGTGIGMSIDANKWEGIRCALCHEHYSAQMTRMHNNANCLALGARVIGIEIAKDIVDTFFSSEFVGSHHSVRVNKLVLKKRLH